MNYAFPSMQAIRRQRERNQRTATLKLVAEEMRKKGASRQSLYTAVKGFYEYLKTTGKSIPAQPLDLTSDLDPHAPGLLLSDLATQQVQWLWEKRIPLGHLTLLDGEPGTGTSLLATTITACVTTGGPMPDGTPGRQGGVVFIAPHDNPENTIKPRLEAAGGDPSQVLLLNTVEYINSEKLALDDRPFSLSEDLDLLEDVIKRIKAILVVIDPLTAVLGQPRGTSRNQQGHTIFTRLAHLAQRTGCAILLIRPLSKRPADPLRSGSTGPLDLFAARSRLLIIPDPDDEHTRLLVTTKHTLSSQPCPLAYQLIVQDQHIPTIHWLGESPHLTSSFLETGPALSAQRQAILSTLQHSSTPLGARDIAASTALDYECVRKMLQRMLHAGELASPARGHYTTPDHPCLAKHITDTNDLPPQPAVPDVPSQQEHDMIADEPVEAEEMQSKASTLVVTDENPPQPTVPDVPSQQEHDMMTDEPVEAEEMQSKASTLVVADENPPQPTVPDVPSQQEHDMIADEPVGTGEVWSPSGVGYFVGAALYQ